MSLEIITASSDEYLTTTAAVKLWLGIASTATSEDATLNALILRASREAERMVGYPLTARAYLETLAGYGGRRLMVSRTPLRAVTGLFNGTDSGEYTQVESSEFSVDAAPGFLERPQGWEWSALLDGDLALHPLVGQETRPWRAEYVAGYTYGGISTDSALWSTEKGTTSTGRTLPEDIEMAVIAKAGAWFDGSDELTAKSVGDLSLTFASGSGGGGRTNAMWSALASYARSA